MDVTLTRITVAVTATGVGVILIAWALFRAWPGAWGVRASHMVRKASRRRAVIRVTEGHSIAMDNLIVL
jgi:hypothetical protein